jgi:hypothetical protein
VHGKVDFETQVKLLPTLMAFKKGKLVFKQAGIANPAVMDASGACSDPPGNKHTGSRR